LEDYFSTEGKYQGPKFQSEWQILYQLTKGLAHLHSLGIVHRDIKPTNILVFVPDGDAETEPQMKLADFDISKILRINNNDFTNTSVTNPSGTRGWMAPEVYELARFDFSVDMFAFGCIFGYTLSEGNQHPFGNDCNERILRIKRKEPMLMVRENLKKPYCDETAFELIQKMLNMDHAIRPTIAEIESTSTFFFIDTVSLHTLKSCKIYIYITFF